MQIYDQMRQFADSWGLIYMMGIFIIVVFLAFRPGAKRFYDKQSRIPLDEEE